MLSSYETGSSLPSLPSLSSILHALNSDFYELQQALNAVGGRSDDGEDRDTALEELTEEARKEVDAGLVRALMRLEAPLRRIADAVESLACRRD